MTQIVTATEITDGQIENAVNKLRDAIRKHRSEITSDVAQQVLGTKNLGMMMFTPFRECAEMVSNIITRKVRVSRNRTPQEALDATGRRQYTNREVVDAMLKGEGDEVELVFFKPEPREYTSQGFISDDDLEKAFDCRGLRSAETISVFAMNEADPTFADEKPHGTHWRDAKGKWCYASFNRWLGERSVIVARHGGDWNAEWWFVGVRK